MTNRFLRSNIVLFVLCVSIDTAIADSAVVVEKKSKPNIIYSICVRVSKKIQGKDDPKYYLILPNVNTCLNSAVHYRRFVTYRNRIKN